MTRNFSTSFTLYLMTADLVLAGLAVRLAEILRTYLPIGVPGTRIEVEAPWWYYLVFPILWVLILNAIGAYSPRATYRAILELGTVFRSAFVAIFVFAGVWYIGHREYSRLEAVYFISLLVIFTLLHRFGSRGFFRITGGRSYDSRRILVMGTGSLAQAVARQVRAYAWTGLYLTGFLRDSAEECPPEIKPILGSIDQWEEIVSKHQIDEVILALTKPTPSYLEELVLSLHEKGIRIQLAPDIQELAYLVPTAEAIGGIVFIGLRDPVMTPMQQIIKRSFDIVISAMAIILALPLMGIIAVAIRLDSPGSPIFVQERLGQGMRPFKMLKFRTMVKDAESMHEKMSRMNEDGQIIHKSPNDPRVTRIGRFLRRTSLDELPQLFNVLKGDMSLVGPRPELPQMVGYYTPVQRKRFEVPQGMTGWWQINGRAENLMHLNAEDDIYYILNYSLWLDLIILMRTIPAVLGGRGAF